MNLLKKRKAVLWCFLMAIKVDGKVSLEVFSESAGCDLKNYSS
jgi:hypothetical protein